MRSSIGSRLIRTKPQATGVDEASAAIFCPQRPPPFRRCGDERAARQRIAIVGSCLCSRSRLHRGAMRICSLRSFTTALITLFLGVGLATSAISQARTSDASGAEPPFAHSREGIRELYIVAFGLFGPESVFASEAKRPGRSCGRGSRQTLSCWFASTISAAAVPPLLR